MFSYFFWFFHGKWIDLGFWFSASDLIGSLLRLSLNLRRWIRYHIRSDLQSGFRINIDRECKGILRSRIWVLDGNLRRLYCCNRSVFWDILLSNFGSLLRFRIIRITIFCCCFSLTFFKFLQSPTKYKVPNRNTGCTEFWTTIISLHRHFLKEGILQIHINFDSCIHAKFPIQSWVINLNWCSNGFGKAFRVQHSMFNI